MNLITMEDYKNKIRSILVSNFRLDLSSGAEKKEIPGVSGLSASIEEINKFIQNEVTGLESEIVRLNDQIVEYDTLFYSTRRRINKGAGFSETGHRRTNIMSH